MRSVPPVVLLLGGVQREQQAGFSAGAAAVDVRRAEPLGRGCDIARGVVRESRTVAPNKPTGATGRRERRLYGPSCCTFLGVVDFFQACFR